MKTNIFLCLQIKGIHETLNAKMAMPDLQRYPFKPVTDHRGLSPKVVLYN